MDKAYQTVRYFNDDQKALIFHALQSFETVHCITLLNGLKTVNEM